MSKTLIIVTNSSSNVINFRGNLIKKLVKENFNVRVIIPKSNYSKNLNKRF